MADAKEQDSSSESEIDTNREYQMQQTQMKQIPDSNQKLQSITVLTGSNSQEGLSGGSTGGKNSTENLNDLPEDKEIQSSSEDEL